MVRVGIIMGSKSDLTVMQEAIDILNSFDVEIEVDIVSAHRTPEKMMEYGKKAHQKGLKVIIAGAGGAAHLPGMVAAITVLPVIGVPLPGGMMDGLDSLLSTVQMPKGVPVGTMSVGKSGSINAAIFVGSKISFFSNSDTCFTFVSSTSGFCLSSICLIFSTF